MGRGGDLGGRPQNLRWGGQPTHPSPNILRNSVVGCVQKHEQSKKSIIKEFLSEIVVVLVRKGSYISYMTFNTGKTWSMTKKRSSEILAVKMEIFSKKNRHSEILVREKNFHPPNSAPCLRPCLWATRADRKNVSKFTQNKW